MLQLDRAALRRALPWDDLVDALDTLFREGCEAPLRHRHAIPGAGGSETTLLLMPAWRAGGHAGVKIVHVAPANGITRRTRGERHRLAARRRHRGDARADGWRGTDRPAHRRGDHPGRRSAEKITAFTSVGWAGEDLAAAVLAYRQAGSAG